MCYEGVGCVADIITDILHSYARKHEVEAILIQNDEYQQSEKCARSQEARLRALLDETAASVFNDFLEELRLLQFKEEEAHFRAGFRMALELTR